MKKLFCFIISLAVMIFLTSSASRQDKKSNGQLPVRSQSGLFDLFPQVWPGFIVIKVREGVSLRFSSGNPVITGISSLDQKLAGVEARSLVKRFRHKPIPKGSRLPDISRIYRLTFPENYDPVQVAALFSQDPNIEYAEPETRMHLCEMPDDPMYSLQQHLPQVMAEQAWDIYKGENGTTDVKIAIVDTGVDWYHEDLMDNIWQNLGEDSDGDNHTVEYVSGSVILDPEDQNGTDDDGNGFVDDLIGWDFYEAQQTGNGSDPDPHPSNPVGAHGTHCAGIACAATNNSTGVAGITWNLKYLPIQADISNDMTFGWDGIVYAADMGADVISNSWGGIDWKYNPFIADIVAYANASGSIILFAAGNNGYDCFIQPAAYPGAVAVGSVNGDDTKTSYSNYGLFVDIMAPGGGLEGGILSTVPGNAYERYFGTSMATPLTAGLMALVKSYHPDWNKEWVVEQVIHTCDYIDGLNPIFEHKLGNGRINAYEALANPGPFPQLELKLEMLDYSVTDADNDGKLMPGDTGIISVRIRNYTHGPGSNAVNLALTNEDQQITIDNGIYAGTIDSDSIFYFESIFKFHVSAQATPHATDFLLTITADVPVYADEVMILAASIAPSGFFVYEKTENGRDYSGTYICRYLEEMGYSVVYSNHFPTSLMGYEAVFLSMGNLVFPNWDPGTFMTEGMVEVIVDYLETGGKMYLEGAGALNIPQRLYYTNSEALQDAFGVLSVGYAERNPINLLSGINGTLCEGMQFPSSYQYNNNWIEKINPKSGAVCSLEESNHGRVAIYNTGAYGQKTFYFAYSLADLKDRDKTSSRYNLLNKVMESLGYSLPEGYLIANFLADVHAGNTSTEVSFEDISLTAPGVHINSWEWDFQNDGIIDSYLAYPEFTFTEPGCYDVRHIVSDGTISDTIILEDFYTAHEGLFVFEGTAGVRDMSGTWMKDFLLDNSYVVTYSNEVPRYIDGYDALFLSFGNTSSFVTYLEYGFADMLKSYLKKGGQVYLEGGAVFGMDQGNPTFRQAFGLQSVVNPGPVPSLFDSINGMPGSICDGISFYGLNQVGQFFVDQYTPLSSAVAAFDQPGYAKVAVQYQGAYSEKTFCFSYALAELEDGQSTREDLMWAILNYFDLVTAVFEEPAPVITLDLNVFPLPTSGRMTVRFILPSAGKVAVEVYDLSGRMVVSKDFGHLARGMHSEILEMGIPSGIYIMKMQAGDRTGMRKIVVSD